MREENITLGTYLRIERERKNIPLAAIARATKITIKNLEALERDEFHLLPPPVFVRGFLRAYAHQVGLDAQKILEMYERQIKSADSALPAKTEGKKKSPHLAKILWPILIIIFGIIIFYSLSKTPSSPPSPAPSPSPASQVTPEIKVKVPATIEKPPRPQITAPEEKKIEPPPPAPPNITPEKPHAVVVEEKKKERRHVLKIKAIEKTWLRLKADEQQEIEALLQPKEIATWTARRQFKITIGNAGGVELTFNGVRQGRLGESGQVVHLVLPPEIKKKLSEEEVEKKD